MEVSFTLWSLHDVLDKIPFNTPVTETELYLDFSGSAVPYYIKNQFKVSFLYDDSTLKDATCCIYSPKKVITIIIIIKRKYEEAFKAWCTERYEQNFETCCLRRELYCHEVCHLISIIRAFPSDKTTEAREDFKEKLKRKFTKSMKDSAGSMAMPLIVSEENEGASPSVFDKDHFRYDNDDLNYFRLYAELMFDHETMSRALKSIDESQQKPIYLRAISWETLVPVSFFQNFPEKQAALRELLASQSN
ncbi:MAG: hypothetical protein LBV68_04940 [Spirochaetaceae bacterium]|nr:hypothetical protein [Spirochaetaceae bacterium]